MDLSKAFDCLPHDNLICKLSVYGLSDNATKLLLSYLFTRKQQIKIGNIVSTWANIQKGCPQGSILEPLLFNVFINDIFYFIKHCDFIQLCRRQRPFFSFSKFLRGSKCFATRK